jgi:NTE family protein
VRARPFTMVLAGGGARGYAHAGVLRALEHLGLRPAGIVGVSMGAVVATTYALREDWYRALLAIDLAAFPRPSPVAASARSHPPWIRRALGFAQAAWSIVTGWGAPDSAAEAGREILNRLFGAKRLDEGRVPVVVAATDLLSGTRVHFESGPAAAAVYASSALAGVLPPSEQGGQVLVDGAYADVAPVDLARQMGNPVVIAVDPGQDAGAGPIRNGLQALMRATEICHHRHAHLRLAEADLVLRPDFGRFVDVLDFGARRACVAAGVRVVRQHRPEIESLLHGGPRG